MSCWPIWGFPVWGAVNTPPTLAHYITLHCQRGELDTGSTLVHYNVVTTLHCTMFCNNPILHEASIRWSYPKMSCYPKNYKWLGLVDPWNGRDGLVGLRKSVRYFASLTLNCQLLDDPGPRKQCWRTLTPTQKQDHIYLCVLYSLPVATTWIFMKYTVYQPQS